MTIFLKWTHINLATVHNEEDGKREETKSGVLRSPCVHNNY